MFIFANMEEKEKQIERAESRLVVLRGKQVIIDRDVAELYGVETKRVNEALRNNPSSPRVMLSRWKRARKTNWSKISTGSIG